MYGVSQTLKSLVGIKATNNPSTTASSCFHNNRSYKLHEEFWEDGSCRKRCRCEGSGTVTCKPGGCRSHEKCVMVNGVAKCTPNKHYTCIGTGDPHYTTFDGVRFDFQGSCIYQFAALCTPKPALVPFNVTVENNHRGSRAVSFTKTVNLEVYGSVISMSQEHPRKVKVGNHSRNTFTPKNSLKKSFSSPNSLVFPFFFCSNYLSPTKVLLFTPKVPFLMPNSPFSPRFPLFSPKSPFLSPKSPLFPQMLFSPHIPFYSSTPLFFPKLLFISPQFPLFPQNSPICSLKLFFFLQNPLFVKMFPFLP